MTRSETSTKKHQLKKKRSFVSEAQFVARQMGEKHEQDVLLKYRKLSTDRSGTIIMLEKPLPKQALLPCVEKIGSTSRLRDGCFCFDDGEGGSGPKKARWDEKAQHLVFDGVPDDWFQMLNKNEELVTKVQIGNKKRAVIKAENVYTFFKMHSNQATLNTLFTDMYVQATSAVQNAQRYVRDVHNNLNSWSERVRLAVVQGKYDKISQVMASTYRRPDKICEVLKEDGEEELPLPLDFRSAMQELATRRDRFPNGGRAILSSGCHVAMRNSQGPCIGVPVGLAMRVCFEQNWNLELLPLVMTGPCQYPGAHYIIDGESGERRYIPLEGFETKKQAEEFVGKHTHLIGRHLMDGDLVGITRSPVVAPHNHMYFRTKVVSGHALRPHDIVLKPFDADFDGDAMILYVPRDLVAAMQWFAQRPGRLLCYQSGSLAMELMLDGLLGLKRASNFPKRVLLTLAAVLPGLRLTDLKVQLLTHNNFDMQTALTLCCKAALCKEHCSRIPIPRSANDVAKCVRLFNHYHGPEAAMALLHNSQNVGAELALEAGLPGFNAFDFISPPALHDAQRALFYAVKTWLKGQKFSGSGTSSWRRDMHEVVVTFTEPFASRGPLGYTTAILETFANAVKYLQEGRRKELQACRDLVKITPSQEETYLTADLKYKIKTPDASAALATGILRGTISEHWRSCAAIAWPEEQPSFVLEDRMACQVSEIGATLQAIHGIEGLSSKAIIAKAGEMRNNAAVLLSDIRRDALGVLRGPLNGVRPGERCALMTTRNMPTSLWVKPAAILDAVNPKLEKLPVCPWKKIESGARCFVQKETSTSKNGLQKTVKDFENWLGVGLCDGNLVWGKRTEKLARISTATEVSEDSCRRKFSGHKLPILRWALINGASQSGPSIAMPPWDLPDLLCEVDDCDGYRKLEGSTSECAKCHHITQHPREAVLACEDVSGEWCTWAPSSIEEKIEEDNPCNDDECDCTRRRREVRRPCSGEGGGWSVFVCVACGAEEGNNVILNKTFYSKSAKRRHRRASGDNNHKPFLRVELNADKLLMAGFTEIEEFELIRILDFRYPDVVHVVVGWNLPSVAEMIPKTVVVLHVFGNNLLNHVVRLKNTFFGFPELRLAEGGIKNGGGDKFRITLHCSGAEGALARIREVVRSSPPGTKFQIMGDYPATLAMEGPEAAARQMVDDHVGVDAGMVGTARVLAARRTWNGKVLSCKIKDGGIWKLLALDSRRAFSMMAEAAYNNHSQCMEGAQRWLGRLEEVGVSAVLLKEDDDSTTASALRAENLNQSELPTGLEPGPPRKTTKRLSFEEQSKCLGVRVLQLIVLGGGDKDPVKQAMQELESKQLRFSVLRRWGGCLTECELVRVRDLDICRGEM